MKNIIEQQNYFADYLDEVFENIGKQKELIGIYLKNNKNKEVNSVDLENLIKEISNLHLNTNELILKLRKDLKN